ncbi:MAG: TolC family protein [Bacillota bacterium]|nr:TolC family protein [Bacillota bacterium]
MRLKETAKKILVSAILVGLTIGTAAVAEDAVYPVFKLKLEEVDQLITSNNKDYQLLDLAVKKAAINEETATDNLEEMREQQDGASSALGNLITQQSQLEQQVRSLEIQLDNPELTAEERAALETQLAQAQQMLINFNLSYSSTIGTLQARLSGLSDTEKQLERGQEQAIRAQQSINDQKELQSAILENSVQSLYYAYLTLDEQIEVQQKNMLQLEDILEVEKIRYNNGLGTLNGIKHVELQLERGKMMLESLANEKITIEENIKLLTGIDADSKLEIEDIEDLWIYKIDLAIAIENATTVGLDVKLKEQDYLWKIDDLEYKKDEQKNKKEDSIEVRLAEIEVEEAKIKLQQAKDKARLNVEENYRKVEIAEKGYRLAQKALDLGKEDMKIAEARFNAGMLTSLELSQSRLDIMKIEQEFYQAKLDYMQALNAFKLAEKGVSASGY